MAHLAVVKAELPEDDLEFGGVVDEKHGVFDVVSRIAGNEADGQESVRFRFAGGVQPVFVVIELDHLLINRDVMAACQPSAVDRLSAPSDGLPADSGRHPTT